MDVKTRLFVTLVCCLLMVLKDCVSSTPAEKVNTNGEKMEEFIDLDEMFGYHVSNQKDLPIAQDQLEIKITAPSAKPVSTTTTTTTTRQAIDTQGNVDDEDTDVISGAGSGSGMDEEDNPEKNNETVLTFLDSEGVQLNSGEGKIKETEDFILTGTTLPSKDSTVKSTKPTEQAPMQSSVIIDHQDSEEGAADGDIINWELPEGGNKKENNPSDDEDGTDENEINRINDQKEQELVTTTLPPTYKQIPELPPYLVVEATDPCQKTECYFGALCVSRDVKEVVCSCEFNCSKDDTVDVCGSDGSLYPNDCSRLLASCEQQRSIDEADLKSCPDYRLTHPELPTCKLFDAPRWGNWSPWIRHGDVDIRMRTCVLPGYITGGNLACDGPRIEAKACKLKHAGRCLNEGGNKTNQLQFACDGIDVKDTLNADLTFGLVAHEDECLYSLYDLTRKKIVFAHWNITRIVNQGSLRRWCHKPDIYIMSHTSVHSCKKSLINLCKQSRKCKRSKDMKQKNLGDYAHGCWKGFLVGNRIPAGLSSIESRFSFICQRFAPDSRLGKVFGHKESYYGTIYDTRSRIPVVSVAAIRSLGDDMWPESPYMIEHGLFEEDSSFFWLFKNKKKGMLSMDDLKRCETEWQCELGKKQALPIDFEHSGYRMAPLLWPELIGDSIDAKLSTFALTNVAPMHSSLYSAWRNAIKEIRKYADEHCHVTVHDKPTQQFIKLEKATLHLASGAVASNDPIETIGNDVNVPFMFWMAGCCIRDTEVKSFAIYARNMANARVISSSVLQLETLLQDIYRVKPRDIGPKIFPGNDGVCGYMKFDDSQNIVL